MQITDNREAYKKRDTLSFFERVALGQRFQHELRVTREVKRRRALRVI